MKLRWNQNFEAMPDGPLDKNAWVFDIGTRGDGWGNGEAQYYTDRTENARIEDGRLVIEARQENFEDSDFTSARLVTRGITSFLYGRIEIEAKLPQGVGTWPAFWLLPILKKYRQDKADDPLDWLRDGEIDIMEHVGADEGQVSSSAHSYTYNPSNQNSRTGLHLVSDATTAFHTYGLDWTSDSLSFSVDGQEYNNVTNPGTGHEAWPYDQPYFLLINLAMGGSWGGYKREAYPPLGIDDTSGPWRLEISSLRYLSM